MMRVLPLFAFIGLAVLCGLALFHGGGEDRPAPPPLLGKAAPKIAGLPPDAYAHGPVVVNFFASWCLPCAAEAGALEILAREGGVPVYGINYKDTRMAAVKFLTKHGNPYKKVIPDVRGETAVSFGATGVPETFIVIDGIVGYARPAPLTEEEVRRRILPLLERMRE